MKKLFMVMLCYMSMSVFAEENKDPNLALFDDAVCDSRTGSCEFTDFRGKSSNVFFEDMPATIAFYTGPLGVNGISCDDWDALCTNGTSEIMGLNPRFHDEEGHSFGAAAGNVASAPQQQPVQQAASVPYKLDDQTSYPYGTGGFAKRELSVISITSGLVINKVTINEDGNGCGAFISDDRVKPAALKMGEALKIPIGSRCNIIKIQVDTNQGSWINAT